MAEKKELVRAYDLADVRGIGELWQIIEGVPLDGCCLLAQRLAMFLADGVHGCLPLGESGIGASGYGRLQINIIYRNPRRRNKIFRLNLHSNSFQNGTQINADDADVKKKICVHL